MDCDALLQAVVDAGFLRRTHDDAYVRADASESRFDLDGDRGSVGPDRAAFVLDCDEHAIGARADAQRRDGGPRSSERERVLFEVASRRSAPPT
jgi:hypothetical protein